AASETCSQGIGEDNGVEESDESCGGASTESVAIGGSAISIEGDLASSIMRGGAARTSCSRNEARIDSRAKWGSEGGGASGSEIWIEALAICSHGMGEGMPFPNPVSSSG